MKNFFVNSILIALLVYIILIALLVYIITADMVQVNELQKRKAIETCIIEKDGYIVEAYSL